MTQPTQAQIDAAEFMQYRRKQIAELRPYRAGEDMRGISISEPDRQNGSPKKGDMIARNPKNHADKWLVAFEYFCDNFEPAALTAAAEACKPKVVFQSMPDGSTAVLETTAAEVGEIAPCDDAEFGTYDHIINDRLKKRPVAWRVRDCADGWIVYDDERKAYDDAEQRGAQMQGLYCRDGYAAEVEQDPLIGFTQFDLDKDRKRIEAATIELCAQVAEWEGYATVGRQIAAAIRALKE